MKAVYQTWKSFRVLCNSKRDEIVLCKIRFYFNNDVYSIYMYEYIYVVLVCKVKLGIQLPYQYATPDITLLISRSLFHLLPVVATMKDFFFKILLDTGTVMKVVSFCWHFLHLAHAWDVIRNTSSTNHFSSITSQPLLRKVDIDGTLKVAKWSLECLKWNYSACSCVPITLLEKYWSHLYEKSYLIQVLIKFKTAKLANFSL